MAHTMCFTDLNVITIILKGKLQSIVVTCVSHQSPSKESWSAGYGSLWFHNLDK